MTTTDGRGITSLVISSKDMQFYVIIINHNP